MADISTKYGSTRVRFTEIVRPADVIAYTAGDVVGSATTDTATTALPAVNGIAGVATTSPLLRITGGSGYIVGIRLTTDQATCVAQFRVHLFKKAQPTTAVPGDNSPMTLMYTNVADRICSIDLPAMKTSTVAGSSTAAAAENIDVRRYLSEAGVDIQDVYVRLETLTAFTPASGQKFNLEIAAEDN